MKKKKLITSEDLKQWKFFTENISNISDKDDTSNNKENIKIQVKKLDLHGLSLQEANKEILNFINKSYDKGLKKLIIITGKGLRSNNLQNPYVSQEMSILKNSVPDFIKNNEIRKKIIKICPANLKDGGSGAFYIFLKNKKIKE